MMVTDVVKRVYHTLVPTPARRWIRATQRDLLFRSAFTALRRDPIGAARNPKLLERLVRGWGNDRWSAWGGYLARCVTVLGEHPGSRVLECGSGLSTLVLGAVAERTGGRVWALENHPEWRERVRAAARRLGLGAVTVCEAPLRDYGEFMWYTVPGELRAERFEVAICDGPPGKTRGGRYGLVPVMHEQLADGCLILVDDAAREGEQVVMRRWSGEFGGTFAMYGADRPYAEFTLGRRDAAPTPA